jgi:hypothetical protein
VNKEIIEFFMLFFIGFIVGFYVNNLIILYKENKNDGSKLDEKEKRK